MNQTYIQGDDISLLINASGDNIDLHDFDITVQLYVKGYESKFCASTLLSTHSAPITYISNTQILVSVPSSATSDMMPGYYMSQTTYVHKSTNMHKSFVKETFVLNKRVECAHG